MNTPMKSKINYTALLIQLVGIAVLLNLIPAEYERPLTEFTLIAGPMVIQVWRTWFTG